MRATIVDLRYHMKDVLQALNRNEQVTVLYHNKEIATIVPSIPHRRGSVKDHPFCRLLLQEELSVEQQIDQLRAGRYNDL